nr:MAG TPA: hypothetical protein [Caudoviricetes sp.]
MSKTIPTHLIAYVSVVYRWELCFYVIILIFIYFIFK